MVNEAILLSNDFHPFPDWDFTEIKVKGFRKETTQAIYRAFINDTVKPSYAVVGKVDNNGKVERWMDCCSKESLIKKTP